jgi:acid phosphatase type 7
LETSFMQKYTLLVRCLLIAAVLFLPSLQAAVVTRGPYLQVSTTSSIVIRWRTDVATDSMVKYGLVQGSLTSSVSDGTLTTEHEIKVTGLSPDTKYFYSVGSLSGSLAGNDANHFFVTHPPIGTAKPTRIWVIGDAGTGDSSQRSVRNAYQNFTGARQTDLWLQLGDNAYSYGYDHEFQTNCFMVYSNFFRNSVSWATIGNHDVVNSNVYFSVFTFPKSGEAGGVPSGSKAYYSFDYGNIHFICLSSDPGAANLTKGSPQWLWASNDLASTTAKWIIAYWHHPPYSKGSHDTDESGQRMEPREVFAPLMEWGGVDLVLSGHSHSYERSYFIDGHYGLSPTFNPSVHVKVAGSGRVETGAYYKKPGAHNGAVYVVAGSSGRLGSGSFNHPAMYSSEMTLGSLVLDVNGNQLDSKFITSTGSTNDYFTIIKSSGETPILSSVTVSPTNSSAQVGLTQQFAAIARDQYGDPMSPQPSFSWTFSGTPAQGSINSSGLFTAGTSAGGPFTITASFGGKSASTQVTVVSAFAILQNGVSGYAGTDDTYINQFSADAINNTTNPDRLQVHHGSSEHQRTLIKFDLSSIPSNAAISSASLTFTVTRTNEVQATDVMLMNKITSAWTESQTWNTGVPASTPSGIVLPVLSNYGPDDDFVINGLGAMVQSWLNSPSSNLGVMLLSSNKVNYRFASSEHSVVAFRPRLAIAYSLPESGDSDSDGLPDSWEQANFSSLNQVGNDDPDGDGMNNLAEFNSGTIPVDRTSRFIITNEAFSGGNFGVSWQSIVGKTYDIEASTTLIDWTIVGSVTASATTSSWLDSSASGQVKKFYRVKLP